MQETMTRQLVFPSASRWRRLGFVGMSATLLLVACGDGAVGPTIEIGSADLPTSAGVDDRGHWQSSAWDQDWIEYPGNTTLNMEHGLGRTPRAVLVYVSFSPDGFGAGLAAGDAARVVAADDQHVAIQNATRENFFVRVALP